MPGVAGLAGWQWLFLIEGLPAIVLGLVVLRYLPNGPEDSKWLTAEEKNIIAVRLRREDQTLPHSLFSGLFDLRVLALCLVYFGIVAALYGLVIWLPQIVASMGFSVARNSFIVSGISIVAVVAMVGIGWSSERFDEYVWHTAVAAIIGALALFVAGASSSIIVILLALAVATAAVYATLSPFWIIPPGFLVGTAAASGMALINAFGNLGGAAGPTLMGFLRESSGGYGSGMSALAIGLVLAALMVVALKRFLPANRAANGSE